MKVIELKDVEKKFECQAIDLFTDGSQKECHNRAVIAIMFEEHKIYQFNHLYFACKKHAKLGQQVVLEEEFALRHGRSSRKITL
jgi:hypothetical protein